MSICCSTLYRPPKWAARNQELKLPSGHRTHRDLEVAVIHDAEPAASQLLVALLPDDVRLGRSKHLASEVDSLTLSSTQTDLGTFLDERRLS